jgi:hypothetical protein
VCNSARTGGIELERGARVPYCYDRRHDSNINPTSLKMLSTRALARALGARQFHASSTVELKKSVADLTSDLDIKVRSMLHMSTVCGAR